MLLRVVGGVQAWPRAVRRGGRAGGPLHARRLHLRRGLQRHVGGPPAGSRGKAWACVCVFVFVRDIQFYRGNVLKNIFVNISVMFWFGPRSVMSPSVGAVTFLFCRF